MRIASFAEMRGIHTVRNEKCVFVIRLLRLIQPLRRDDHIIAFLHELAFEPEDGSLIGSREFRIFVDTVCEEGNALDCDKFLFNGVFDELGAVVHVDFFHEVVFVHVHGLHAEAQSSCDFLHRQSFRQKFQDLSFTRAQAIVTGLRREFLTYPASDTSISSRSG